MGVLLGPSGEAVAVQFERLESGEVPGLNQADLSPWFNPFLRHFVRETLRCGGSVRVVRAGGALTALVLEDPAENIRSIFTRSREQAEMLVRDRGTAATYSDFRFDAPSEAYGIFRGSLAGVTPDRPFRHPVRRVTVADLPRVNEIVRELHGEVDPRWFQATDDANETGFLVEIEGRLAGVGWVAVVEHSARLHSLAVRPAYHHLGLGADLLQARLLWARRAGATEVLSEIADRNAASRAVAETGGMSRVGEIYLYAPARPQAPA